MQFPCKLYVDITMMTPGGQQYVIPTLTYNVHDWSEVASFRELVNRAYSIDAVAINTRLGSN